MDHRKLIAKVLFAGLATIVSIGWLILTVAVPLATFG
jgi:hypothetical protein